MVNRKFISDTKGGFKKPTSGDVELLKPLALLQYQYMHPEKENVFFEEVTLTEEETLAGSNAHRIRQGIPETSLRIANFLMISVAKSSCMERILDLCRQRQQHVYEDYDVLYTTGPDITSSAVSLAQIDGKASSLQIISKSESRDIFFHHCVGHWWNSTQ
eukprot:gene25542-34099_t